ncbi:putative reverse transcriptase domain-containing protein [Tanacetum coccineum]
MVILGADEELSDGGPEHPPFPDYVPGPEHQPSPVEVPYVPKPEYPEYLVIRYSVRKVDLEEDVGGSSDYLAGDKGTFETDESDLTSSPQTKVLVSQTHLFVTKSCQYLSHLMSPSMGQAVMEYAVVTYNHPTTIHITLGHLHILKFHTLPPPPIIIHLPHCTTSLPFHHLHYSSYSDPPPVDRREGIFLRLSYHLIRGYVWTAPTSRYEVGESSTTAPRPTRGHRADYGFIDTMGVEIRRARHTGYLFYDKDTLDRQTRNNMPPRRTSATTARAAAPMTAAAVEQLIEASVFAALANHETLRNSTNGHGDGSHNFDTKIRGTISTPLFHISNCAVENQVKFATCTFLGNAFTWWNSHMKTVTQDLAYAMEWKALKKIMTVKYCPRGEIKKLEIKLWNLKVKEEVEKYIGGLPDMIWGNVMSYQPKTMEKAIEFANE